MEDGEVLLSRGPSPPRPGPETSGRNHSSLGYGRVTPVITNLVTTLQSKRFPPILVSLTQLPNSTRPPFFF